MNDGFTGMSDTQALTRKRRRIVADRLRIMTRTECLSGLNVCTFALLLAIAAVGIIFCWPATSHALINPDGCKQSGLETVAVDQFIHENQDGQ
jgi:hypothetical protein